MGGSKCCDKEGLKRGPWTAEEDQKLTTYIQQHGHGNWSALPEKAGLKRCGKSCRLRWINYLRPDIKRGKFSLKEEHTIIQLHALLGNRWSAIAAHLPKRTDNEIKNHWNTHLKKRLIKMGIDPMTHKPRINALASPSTGHATTTNDATLSHMAQWERARLEAEARSSSSSSSSSLSLEYSNKQALQNQLGANIPLPLTPTAKYHLDVVPKPWQVGAITGMSNYFANHDNIGLVQDVPTVEVNNSSLYACNELDGVVDGWKCLDHGFNQMAQGLEDGLDESTSTAAPLQGLSSTTTYSTENNAWTLVDCYGMESSSSDTLIGFPVSFSSMEVEIPNGSCNIADNGSYRVSDWDTTVKFMNDSSGSFIYRHPNPSSQT